MRESLRNSLKQAEVVNLGSQYAFYDFFYEDLPVNGVNLAGLPQYLNYDYKILKKYGKYIKKDTKILIALPNFVFAVDSKKISTNTANIYKLFYPWEIEKFSITFMLRTYVSAIIRKIKGIVCKIMKTSNVQITHPLSYEEKMQIGINRITGWKKDIGIPSMQDGNVPEFIKNNIDENIKYLNLIVEECWKMECKPIIIIPPVSKEMNEMVSKECIQAYLLNPLKRRKDISVKFYNYLWDDRFQDMGLYRWADCLNHKGAKLFTKTVLEEIGAIT